MPVIAKLSKDTFHSAIVCLRQVRVVLDSHVAEGSAWSPDHVSLVPAVVDHCEHRIGIKFRSVRGRFAHGKRCIRFGE